VKTSHARIQTLSIWKRFRHLSAGEARLSNKIPASNSALCRLLINIADGELAVDRHGLKLLSLKPNWSNPENSRA
jgi:hypothetical protein